MSFYVFSVWCIIRTGKANAAFVLQTSAGRDHEPEVAVMLCLEHSAILLTHHAQVDPAIPAVHTVLAAAVRASRLAGSGVSSNESHGSRQRGIRVVV